MQPLPPGTNETRTLIVVRYQSDGIVPGSTPGPYGKTAHVQLLYRMPLMEMIGTENESIPIAQAEEKQPGLGCIMALGGILSVAYLITLRRREIDSYCSSKCTQIKM